MAEVTFRAMIVRLWALYLLLAYKHVQAQFNQQTTFRPIQLNEVWTQVPHWRREDWLQWQPVIRLPNPIVLEYNCHKMPAICNNVDRWYGRDGRASPTNVAHRFHWDVGQAQAQPHLNNAKPAQLRRRQMCPANWKGDYLRPRCPEANQPQVVPPLWGRDGRPVTGLKWPTLAHEGAPAELSLMIEDGRDSPLVGALQPSGRTYSCDEFPPASWVEGGDGPNHQSPGTTYCAPIHISCNTVADPADARGSEQNWQGLLHTSLGALLNSKAVDDAHVQIGTEQYNYDSAIEFYFRIDRNGANHPWAGRIYYNPNGPILDALNPGASWRRRSFHEGFTSGTAFLDLADFHTANLSDYGYEAIEYIPDLTTGALTVKMPVGRKIAGGDSAAFSGALLNATLPSNSENTHALMMETAQHVDEGLAVMANYSSSKSFETHFESRSWDITAADIDTILATCRYQTQQQPLEGVLNILELGTRYIRGQIGQSNQTRHGIKMPLHRWKSQEYNEDASLSSRAVEGPIQCGLGKPCLDGSCCNTDGKCGFKSAHCGETCISNCDAKAMCGVDSADGKTPCGLKLCCSYYGWCGTEEVHCIDPEPQIAKTPCQAGYGSCKIIPSPTCGKSSGTAKGRRIGYYQGWNTRERICHRVSPRQINTRGLTHLFYSFAFFHPTTFEIMPKDAGDVSLYGEFTALKRNGLQTWIAIGGWSFNDPGTVTFNAFSNMVSTPANRAAFINSLISFMDLYGFQGADIDWEYPAEPKRGGRKEDTDNLVLLMKEMHEAFGGRYGSSLTIAPDYWYLRGFKPAQMQNYVDFMGFMSYDLHGPWDEDVKTLGSVVRPQTDITEIDRNLKPLWFDGVDPAKINLGIAYYGRTYKLTDPSCWEMGCRFLGEGAAGSCTQFPGVLSNREIRSIIKEENITPYFNTTAMVKYFKYKGDSWVGYDDEETYAMKEAYANDRCLGGIMIWSIDYDDETGGGIGLDNPNGYKSPESATIIPMSHTTVSSRQTFTVGNGASTDIPKLPKEGNQNTPSGPGSERCNQCSFFRRITSTCCGTGGSVGNPILIPAGVPTPMDIPLPSGFVPSESFTDTNGVRIPANQPLPRETIIPRNTVFAQPFVIDSGLPLREGEGDDQTSNSSSLVWLNPEIWNDPNPQVQCFFPCTFVLPPWPSFTTTIDYPRITVTQNGTTHTTLTFPPLTVSHWEPSTIVVNNSCTATSCPEDDGIRTSSVQIRTTSTWPFVSYTSSGTVYTTRPPTRTDPPDPKVPDDPRNPGCLIFCPPPPPNIHPPNLTIKPGPPRPTANPCAYAAQACPPVQGPRPPPGFGTRPSPGVIVVPPGEEPEEADPENFCLLQPSKTQARTAIVTVSTDVTTIVPKPTQPPRTFKQIDLSKDKVNCYNSGLSVHRENLIKAVDDFCMRSYSEGDHIPGGDSRKWFYSQDSNWHAFVDVEIEMKDDCEWIFKKSVCQETLRKIIDRCDTSGVKRKQGGVIEGNCWRWRLDPNNNDLQDVKDCYNVSPLACQPR